MFDNLLSGNLMGDSRDSKNRAAFDLGLVHQERAGDITFLIGTILALIANAEEERSIVQRLSDNKTPPSASNSVRTTTIANWLFLAAISIFANTSYTRLQEQKASIPVNASLSAKKKLFSREIVTIGDFVKVFGFTLAAIGYQMMADNPE